MGIIRCSLATLAGVWLFGAGAMAGTVVTDQATFVADLNAGYSFHDFNSLDFVAGDHSYDLSQGAYSYNASTSDYYDGDGPVDNPPAILFIDAGGSVAMIPAGGSTSGSGDVLTLNFTSGNVTAVGGDFFLTDFQGNVRAGDFTLTLSDGTSVPFSDAGSDNFFGYVSATPITSLTFTPPTPFTSWATIDNLYVGAGTAQADTPEPSTFVLLIGAVAAGLASRYGRAR